MSLLYQSIAYLKGVGEQKAELLKQELNICTCMDLLDHIPIRYLDKRHILSVQQLYQGRQEGEEVQVLGTLIHIRRLNNKRAVAQIQSRDSPYLLHLQWFQITPWVYQRLQIGQPYLVFGKLSFFKQNAQIHHPEMERYQSDRTAPPLIPIYASSEKLKVRGLGNRQLGALSARILQQLTPGDLSENIPDYILRKEGFPDRRTAYRQIHYPDSLELLEEARSRFKFEDFFFTQIRLLSAKIKHHTESRGIPLPLSGEGLVARFVKENLPFTLTKAQRRVLSEIVKDLKSGRQMQRMLQGDVGSGKTIVALLSMLIAIENGYQSALIAPTEVLAQQHFSSLQQLLRPQALNMALLSGSTTKKNKEQTALCLEKGLIQILIGTHAVLEPYVTFKNLALCVIDEQHKFGVAQRAKLWEKSTPPPHMLLMSATPIPRTLAMSLYADLDLSIIDELPPGRQSIDTSLYRESQRTQIVLFLKNQITQGRQVYIIYPLIEESETLAYQNLSAGYERLRLHFPEDKYTISIVHGKQKNEEKNANMHAFVTGKAQIMVATTVIEVGINVPNATVMLIENAERFGLSQLHQLRGRIGRGSEKSYCLLMCSGHLSDTAQQRLQIMCQYGDGFTIAEKDLDLRGPGDMESTQQSGALNFRVANLSEDKDSLILAQQWATRIAEEDHRLLLPQHQPVNKYLNEEKNRHKSFWRTIS